MTLLATAIRCTIEAKKKEAFQHVPYPTLDQILKLFIQLQRARYNEAVPRLVVPKVLEINEAARIRCNQLEKRKYISDTCLYDL